MNSKKVGYLILIDGTVYEGELFGAQIETIGEVVFTTSMTGYQETLTDPSYFGQIVVATFPLIGNYGMNKSSSESGRCWLKGYVVRECCKTPSNFRSQGNLNEWLKKEGITGIEKINTRALTKKIREYGVCSGYIAESLEKKEEILNKLKNYKIKDAIKSVSNAGKNVVYDDTLSKTLPTHNINKKNKFKIALIDYGAKHNIIRCLERRGCEVIVLDYNVNKQAIQELNPDGIMLSNGPGNPAENTEIIENLRDITTLKIPTLGICLGHQLLALSRGFSTRKLKYGHRGSNQPVFDTVSKKALITTQNHGYEVVSDSIEEEVGFLKYYNPNDNSCEGIVYKDIPAFTVQFHPEACGGPLDADFIFDDFMDMIEKYKSGENLNAS